MRNPTVLSFSLAIFFLLSIFTTTSSAANNTTSNNDAAFLECLKQNSHPNYPISPSIYIPQSQSYPSILQAYIRNLRFNESTTPKPKVIVAATHVSHIQAAVVCGKRHHMLLKIRSGGHDYEGLSYVSDAGPNFFVLDMFNLRRIQVSIENETAWVQVGATLGELYYRIAEKSNVHGFPAGVCPTVGVGGHFSGGGYGNLIRKYGTSVDNIIDAQIVDVNGQFLDRKSMGEDLFWAITGGGGASFCVILAYKIKLVAVPEKVTVFNIPKTFATNAVAIAQRFQQIGHKLPRDLFIRMNVGVVNEGQNRTIRTSFMAMFLGDSEKLVSLMNKRFPELGVKKEDCTEMRWIESVLFWTEFPEGTPIEALLSRVPQSLVYGKVKSDYMTKPMPQSGIELLLRKMVELEIPFMQFNPYGGRMNEIPSTAKPFPHRAGYIMKMMYFVDWNNNSAIDVEERNLGVIRAVYDYMTPFVTKSRQAFLNYRDIDLGVNSHRKNSYLEGAVYGKKYFEGNFDRLVKVKTMVDPHNFFRYEQSIPVLPKSFGKYNLYMCVYNMETRVSL